MTQIFTNNAMTVVATGKTVTTSATSASATLPTVSDGASIPRYIRVAATAPACFRLGFGSAPTAVATDLQVQPGDAVILSTNGATHFAAIQVSAAGVVQVSPLENL